MTILDELMPVWDARRVEQRVVEAPLVTVYQAALTADFIDAVRRSPIVKTLFAIRSAAERAVAFVVRRKFEQPPTPAALRLIDMPTTGEWIGLGQSPTEIAFGVIGKFWGGETKWRSIRAAEFAGFSRAGFAKIGCHLRVIPYGEHRTVVSYEARTLATDAASRRAFLRYWRVVSPFVGVVMRSTLAVIDRDARKLDIGAHEPDLTRNDPAPAEELEHQLVP
jgi:hypothetical protein